MKLTILFLLSIVITPKNRLNRVVLSSVDEQVDVVYEVDIEDIEMIKCIKADGKDYLLIESNSYDIGWEHKQLLIDSDFNVIKNTL